MRADYFTKLLEIIPPQKTAVVIAALRHDPLVWGSLENEEFIKGLSNLDGENLSFWSPANLALISAGCDLSVDELNTCPMISLPEPIYQKALQAYEDLLRNGGKPKSLVDAGLSALALRERRRKTGSWQGLIQELTVNSHSLAHGWQTSLACLYRMIPDPFDLLCDLLQKPFPDYAISWVSHILLSNPMDNQDRFRWFKDLLVQVPLSTQVSWLRLLKLKGENELAGELSKALLFTYQLTYSKSLDTEVIKNNVEQAYKRMLDLQLLSSLFKIAGQSKRTTDLLNALKLNFKYWMDGLEVQLADATSGMDDSNLNKSKLQERMAQSSEGNLIGESIIATKGLVRSKLLSGNPFENIHPYAVIKEAVEIANSGDLVQAYQMAIAAVAQLEEDVKANNSLPGLEFVSSWEPLDLVQSLLEMGLTDEALKSALIILEVCPSNAALVEQISRIYGRLEEKNRAIDYAYLAILLDPDNTDFHRHLASLWEDVSVWDKAAGEREKVIDLSDASSITDLLALAGVYARLNVPSQVIEACNRVLELDPNQGKAHALIGTALLNSGIGEEAATHLRMATSLSPQDPSHWLLLAKLQEDRGNFEESLNTLRTALLAVPDSSEVNLALAQACLKMNSATDALAYLKTAANLELLTVSISLELGRTLFTLGSNEDAYNVLSNARNKWSKNPDLAFTFAQAALKLDKCEEAVAALEVAIKNDQPDAKHLILYAQTILTFESNPASIKCMTPDERLLKARQALVKALNIDPENFTGRLLMAEILQKIGEGDSSFDIYSLLVETPEGLSDQWRARVQKGFGKAALALGQIETALATLQEVAIGLPTDIELQQLLSEAFCQADLKKEAIQVSSYALKLAPNDLANIWWYVKMMVRLNKEEEAITALQYATQLAPDCPDYWIEMAELQVKIGDLLAVQQSLKILLTLENLSVEHLRRAAFTFLRLEDQDSALACLERAVTGLEKPSPDLLFELTMLYQSRGDFLQALDVLQKAIDQTPDNICMYIMQSDLLALLDHNQEAFDCLMHAESLLEECKSTELWEGWVGKLTGALSKHWLDSIQSPAGINIRYAYLYHKIGDLQTSLQYAEKAHRSCPEDYFFRLMSAELAATLLLNDQALELAMPEGIEQLGDVEYRKLSERQKVSFVNLLALQAELDLQTGQEAKATKVIERGLNFDTRCQRLNASRARLLVRRGDWRMALEVYNQLKKSLDMDSQADLKIASFLPESYLDKEIECRKDYWLAETAFELYQWDYALGLLGKYTEENPNEPCAWLSYTKMLVLSAEKQRLFAELKCEYHAPGVDKLNEISFGKFEEAISRVEVLVNSPEPGFWRIRGHAVFHPNPQSVRALATLPAKADNTAALISGLRQVDLASTAMQMGSKFPDDPLVSLQSALCYKGLDTAIGIKEAEHGVAVRPVDPTQHVALALLAQEDGQIDVALGSLETALNIWPDEPEWHAWAANLAGSIGNITTEQYHLQSAVQLKPEKVEYLVALGRNYLITCPNKALDTLERASRLEPESVLVWLLLAQAYRQTGRVKEAIECSDRAGILDPQSPLPLLLCGEIALDMKNLELAYEYAQEAFRRNSQEEKTVLFMSKVLIRQGRLLESLSVLEQSLSTLNSSLPVLFERAKLSRVLHGARTALPMLSELSHMHPGQLEVVKLLAKVQVETSDLKSAEQTTREALRLDSGDPELNLMMGGLQRSIGQLDQAIYYLSEAIRQSPSQIEPYLELGKAYEERREFLMALRVYQQAIKIVPTDHRPYYLSGLMMRESKDYSGAEAMLRRAAEFAPDDVNIRKLLGVVITLNLVHNSLEAKLNL